MTKIAELLAIPYSGLNPRHIRELLEACDRLEFTLLGQLTVLMQTQLRKGAFTRDALLLAQCLLEDHKLPKVWEPIS